MSPDAKAREQLTRDFYMTMAYFKLPLEVRKVALESARQHWRQAAKWIGCSECDCIFPCYDGKVRCIRLPKEPAAPQSSTASKCTAPSQKGVGQGEIAEAAAPRRPEAQPVRGFPALPGWIQRELNGFEHISDGFNWTMSAKAIRVMFSMIARPTDIAVVQEPESARTGRELSLDGASASAAAPLPDEIKPVAWQIRSSSWRIPWITLNEVNASAATGLGHIVAPLYPQSAIDTLRAALLPLTGPASAITWQDKKRAQELMERK